MENKTFDFKNFFMNNKFNDKPKLITQIIILDLILIIVTALGFVSIDIFQVGLIFIFLPALFASIACLSLIQINKNYDNKEFYHAIKNYYSIKSPYFGCFDILKGFLFSLLVGFIGSILTSVIFTYGGSEGFIQAEQELMTLINAGDIEGAYSLIETNEYLVQFYNINSYVSLSFATIFLIFRTGKFVFNLEVRPLLGSFGANKANLTFKYVWRKNSKSFSKDYLTYTWYISISILLVYVVSSIICFKFGLSDYSYIISTSLSLLIGSIFLPKFVIFVEALTEKNLKIFHKSFQTMVDDTIRNLEINNSINQETKEKLKKMMNDIDKEFDESDDNDNNSNE